MKTHLWSASYHSTTATRVAYNTDLILLVALIAQAAHARALAALALPWSRKLTIAERARSCEVLHPPE